MKNTLNHFLVISVLLFAVSCKKTDKDIVPLAEPPIEKPAEKPTDKDKTTSVTWNFESFIVDDSNVSQIFPGAVFDIKSKDTGFEMVSLKGKFTLLPITASSSIIGSADKIFVETPSAEKIFKYVESLSPKTSTESLTYNETEFKDYKVIKFYLANNHDVDAIFKKLAISSPSRITKKTGVVLVSNTRNFSVDMDFPLETELITRAEVSKLSQDYNPYYIDNVFYGVNSLMLAEADGDFASIKLALKALAAKQNLTPEQSQLLSSAKVTFYARGGSEKSFIETAEGIDKIKLTMEALETFTRHASPYPVSYSLRALTDFKSFKSKITLDIIN